MRTPSITRRNLVQLAGLALPALAAPSIIRPSAAQSAGVVNVWTYANFLPDAFREQFQRDTGIEVRVRLVDDQGKQFNLLAAEAPNPSVDLLTVAGHRFRQFIDSDLLAPIDTARLKNWGGIEAIYTDGEWLVINGQKWGVPILMGAEGLAYNTEMVTPEEAQSWAVMFDPEYAQQTAYTIQDMMSCTLLYLGHDGNMIAYLDKPDEARRVVEEARNFLIEHKGQVRKFYDSGAEVQQMFINQDIVLAQAWSGPIAKLIMDGFPVDLTIPKEGSFGFVYTLNVPKGAPNADNAYRLLDAILAAPEVGAEMTRASGFISTLKGAEAPLSELERKAASFSPEELERIVFFRAEANEMKYDLIDRAVEEIKAA